MTLVVAPIPVGAKLIDTIAPLGLGQLVSMREAGVEGVIAYLGGNLTPTLLEDAQQAKVGVVPVNFSRAEQWQPSAQLGQADAARSVRLLQALGVPLEGLYDWCDLEGCGSDPTGYLHGYAPIILSAGAKAGLYVGAGGLLSGTQLYALPGFTGYWRSQSRGIPEPQCGFVLSQLYPSVHCAGTLVDYDYAQHDFQGRSATWLVGAG